MSFRIPAAVAVLMFGILTDGAAASSVPSITIQSYDAQSFAAEQTALTNRRVETFESIAAGEHASGLMTQVGRFDTLGGTGSGSTVSGTSGNTGTALYLRDRSTYGRVNTTSGGSRFLDSNDTYGIIWDIGGIGFFDRILLNISDFGDAGGKLTVSSGGTVLTTFLDGRRNGLVDTVTIQFAASIDAAILNFQMSRLNDGFAIDDVTIGSTPAAVPLPPALLLLCAAAASLAMVRRRARAV